MRNCTTVLALFAALVLALFAEAADAATITFAGSHLDIGEYIRTTDRDGDLDANEVKEFDADGDNVYGTDGYIFMGIQEDETDFGYKHNQQGNTRTSAPSYLTIGTNFSTVQAPTNSTVIDSPDLSGPHPVENDRSGVGLRYSVNTQDPQDLITLTVGSGFPATGARVGVFTDNGGTVGDKDDINYYTLTQTVGGSDSATFATSFDKDNGNDFYFVDITGAGQNDVFVISASSPDNYGPYIGGVTFDTISTGPPPPPTGALVYESMSHPTGAGQLHGNTADTGLGAWNVNPAGSGQIIAPGMGYTDGNGNVLPTAGNRYETVSGFNDLARASIDTTAWSGDNKDGGKLNAKGAEIWFSALMKANTITHNHFHLDFTDTANGNASWENGPGYFAIGKATGNNNWEVRADNDDGDADVQAFSTAAVGTDTFILGRLLTDATTGDTTFDAWFNPLLDTAPGAAGTGDLSITLAANDDGTVTQFDTLGYRHQKWESPNLLDEIRMGETFNSVVGLSTAAVPEPSTFVLFVLGLLGLALAARRKR